jgi:methylated-DNA-[protein]-cysteine S-methyltransferase
MLACNDWRLVAFDTAVGPIGIVLEARTDRLFAVRVGFSKRAALTAALRSDFPHAPFADRHAIAELLAGYAEGRPVDWTTVALAEARLSEFARRVSRACQTISIGTTATYGELAERAGLHKRFARAVGGVMRRNPWPIVVPCHRVTPSSGGLGNYSAPLGSAFKRRLLELEAGGSAKPTPVGSTPMSAASRRMSS